MRVMETPERADQMRRLLERREREGLTYRQAAALEPGITTNKLFWWRRKLFGSRAATPLGRRRSEKFVELVRARAKSSSRVEIVIRGERRLVVDADIDESVLVRIVRALERC